MGVSTNGQICFGIMLPEDCFFPWNGEKYDGDIDGWWIEKICGYKPLFELYDEAGEYINGIEPPADKVDEYYNHRSDFADNHPVPVEVVNYCSSDYPMYIIAIPSTTETCRRGDPLQFDPSNCRVSEKEEDSLIFFCEKYCKSNDGLDITLDMQPYWYLSSYWG